MSTPVAPPPPPSVEDGLEKVQSKAEPGKELLLSAWNLQKHFPLRGGILSTHIGDVRAVDGVTMDLRRGETVGLVGESGCGKTTVGRLLLRLIEPTRGHTFYFDPEKPMPPDIENQLQSLYDGLERLIPPGTIDRVAALRSNQAAQPILKQLDQIANRYSLYRRKPREMRRMRGKMQIVFQDPFSSLSPRMLVRDIVSEPLAVHHVGNRKQRYQRVAELLASVGLNPEHVWRFPHEFSGGQRQRIGIARALALRPDFIVLDEPTSALDVSVQAQILNILLRLQREQRLSYLFISHHLSVVRAISHRVVVMYLGKVVERAPTEELFENPLHPYTQALLSAIPIPDPTLKRERIILSGDVPSPAAPPSGCRFHTRCPKVMAICSKVEPPLLPLPGRTEHSVACHLYSEENFPALGLLGARTSGVIEIPARGSGSLPEVSHPGKARGPQTSGGPAETPIPTYTDVRPLPPDIPAPPPEAPTPDASSSWSSSAQPLRYGSSEDPAAPETLPSTPPPPPPPPEPSGRLYPPLATSAPPPSATPSPAPPPPPQPSPTMGRRPSAFASYNSSPKAPLASGSSARPPSPPPPAPTPEPTPPLPSSAQEPPPPPAPASPPWRMGKLSEGALTPEEGAEKPRLKKGSGGGSS